MTDTIVCVGSGPSFNTDQAVLIRGALRRKLCRVLVVNDNYRMVPEADWLYACDGKWWLEHWKNVRWFPGAKWTQDSDAAHRFGLNLIHMYSAGTGLCTHPSRIHAGGNSGYQAVNLAYHFGAQRVVLVGYDMQATDGKNHWFGEHPEPLRNDLNEDLYGTWRKRFKQLAIDLHQVGVEMLNCSSQTALTCVARAELKDVLV